MADYAGGAFVPGATYTAASTTASGATFTNSTWTGGTITAATLTSATLTAPALSAPVVTGAATVASGATLTTPTVLMTAYDVIATGATGANAATITAVMPALINCNATGVSGAGINLPTGVAGDWCQIQNQMTGVLKVYAIASTINGVTGTTGVSFGATGNRIAWASCTVAGAWNLLGNT